MQPTMQPVLVGPRMQPYLVRPRMPPFPPRGNPAVRAPGATLPPTCQPYRYKICSFGACAARPQRRHRRGNRPGQPFPPRTRLDHRHAGPCLWRSDKSGAPKGSGSASPTIQSGPAVPTRSRSAEPRVAMAACHPQASTSTTQPVPLARDKRRLRLCRGSCLTGMSPGWARPTRPSSEAWSAKTKDRTSPGHGRARGDPELGAKSGPRGKGQRL